MVEREGQLQTFRRHPPAREHRARVVDQHVDALLARRDRGAHAASFGHAGEIGQMHAMAEPRRNRLEPAQRRLGAALVAGDEDDAGASSGELHNRDFADP